jgi:DNA-binding response OmpR family regulator
MSTGARILVVDDQPNIADMLVTVLTFHGFTVATAATATQAQDQMAAQHPDLIVLDVMLPDGDGFDLCHRLHAQGHRFGIVFLTAPDGRRDLVADLTFAGDDYIKPFAVDELLARIRAVLRRVSAQAGSDTSGNDLKLTIDYNTTASGAYPIVLVTYEIVCEKGTAADKLRLLKAFLTHAAGDGQAELTAMGYAPLPAEVQTKITTAIGAMS